MKRQVKRRWIAVWSLIFSSVLIVVLTQPAWSIAPPINTVAKMSDQMGRLIGRKLTRPIRMADPQTAPAVFAPWVNQALGRSGAITFAAKKVDGRWVLQDRNEKMDTCWIVWLIDYNREPSEDSLLAHEIYHCFQNEITLAKLPDWFSEGAAMWAGEAFTRGTRLSQPMWRSYLGDQKSLFDRYYDAIGFFFHLEESGVNVWKALDPLYKTGSTRSNVLFDQVVSTFGDSFLTTWASGLARLPNAGKDWNTSAPGMTLDRREPIPVVLTEKFPLSAELDRATQALYSIQVPTGKVIRFDIEGYGALRWTGRNRDVKFKRELNKRYCVGRSCQCKNVETMPSDRVLLAVTGSSQKASIKVEIQETTCKSS